MLLRSTESLCPICLRRVHARVIGENDDNVYMEKSCPTHGSFKVLVWKGVKSWILWNELNDWEPERFEGEGNATEINKGCPLDCGLCPQHLRKACIVVAEITNRCNLKCPVCFASANERYAYDAGMDTIDGMFRTVLRYECKNTVPTVQISGGEPTIRDDLPEVVAMARELGINHVMINTNGIRIAKDRKFLRRLKENGVSVLYLQFDGVTDDVYLKLRGTCLMSVKVKAIKNCAELGVGVVLVPTVVKGVNFHQVGDLITFAKKWIPTVRGVHFQPISYFGRHPYQPDNDSRITIPDMLKAIEEQTNGEIRANNFVPINLGRGSESHCSFTNVSILTEGGKLLPITDFPSEDDLLEKGDDNARSGPKHARKEIKDYWKSVSESACACSCKFYTGDFGELAECLQEYYLAISGMPFQDVWNIDTGRCRKCCIHLVTPDCQLIPFCTFNITNVQGETLYRDQVYKRYLTPSTQQTPSTPSFPI
ncbi:MAG: radical SAM protein [Nitrososphaerota archaeon]|nr:radical SAM protein [Candidatus Bathyarchaeota archaeon]MDW8022201.1 radical SAM protein [Nitrososphaerota archaeon]